MEGTNGTNANGIGDALDLPGLSADQLTSTQAGLSPELRQLHRKILENFVRSGIAPGQERLETVALRLALDTHVALDQLEASDLIVRDTATGEITGAYPFSATPTRHRVEVAGGEPVYAMCAVDALGIPGMLGRDGVITSADPIDGTPIRVEIRAGRAVWQPEGAVVFIGSTGQVGSIAQTCCSVINFFASTASAQEFQRRRGGVTGRLLSQDEALELGRAAFSRLLHSDHG